jgi:hypothetical protein
MTNAHKAEPRARDDDRIDLQDDYAVCAWARYFNTTQQRLKDAVQTVGDRAGAVKQHLLGGGRPGERGAGMERPSGA